jgi:hypothetical protein
MSNSAFGTTRASSCPELEKLMTEMRAGLKLQAKHELVAHRRDDSMKRAALPASRRKRRAN